MEESKAAEEKRIQLEQQLRNTALLKERQLIAKRFNRPDGREFKLKSLEFSDEPDRLEEDLKVVPPKSSEPVIEPK
jgi:flagellar hook protein FlgE